MTYHHSPDDKLAATCAAAVKGAFAELGADKQGAFVREGTPGDAGKNGGLLCQRTSGTRPSGCGQFDAVSVHHTLLTAERNYDAAKAEWQRELYLALGKPGLSLNYWDALAKGAPGSLLRELHTAYIAARKAYDDAGEEVAEDLPDDERCGDCDGLRGSCWECQADNAADARRGEDYP